MCVFGGKTMQNKYENLTPEAIGEIGDTEAINQLQTLIECGTIAERRRAAEATQKAYNKDKPEMKKLVPSLLINLRSDDAHLRLYSLRALNEFDLNEVELKKIDYVAKNDDARYNRVLAESIIKKQRTIPLMQQTVNISKNQPLPEQMEQYRPSSMIKLSNRDKDMYLYEPGNVEKYSAN